MANPIIKIKRGSTTPANLSASELAIDLTNLNLFVGKADGSVLAIGGEGTFATKAYADAAVSTANTALTAAIAAEETARIAADNTLDGKITTASYNVTFVSRPVRPLTLRSGSIHAGTDTHARRAERRSPAIITRCSMAAPVRFAEPGSNASHGSCTITSTSSPRSHALAITQVTKPRFKDL